jgi:cytochrome c-type biogenesis protein CcmE
VTRKGRRLTLIGVALVVVGVAVGLALYAMSDSIALFLTPSEVAAKALNPGVRLRLGGLVEVGSVTRGADAMIFKITDNDKSVGVDCAGACFANVPDLFREGQGVVAEGTLSAGGRLSAEAILAKHDERYMPREVVDSLKRQGLWVEGRAKP